MTDQAPPKPARLSEIDKARILDILRSRVVKDVELPYGDGRTADADLPEKLRAHFLWEGMSEAQRTKSGPKFDPGSRVAGAGEQSGRVQSISMQGDEFAYLVKWDVGRESVHLESELTHEPLPPHYP